MVAPALLYLAINHVLPDGYLHGWGIPMATDTGIAIAILTILGSRVPQSLIAFLVGLAIIDDIGAISVIAIFYTESLAAQPLLTGLGIFSLLILANAAGLRYLRFLNRTLRRNNQENFLELVLDVEFHDLVR